MHALKCCFFFFISQKNHSEHLKGHSEQCPSKHLRNGNLESGQPSTLASAHWRKRKKEEEEEDERRQAIQIQKGMPSSSLEEQHLASYVNVSFDSFSVRLSLYKSPSDPSGQSLSWLP